MARLGIGWRLPDFPTDGEDYQTFLGQIAGTLDLIHDHFDSAWVADHVVPWASWQSVETPAVECWTTLTFLAARYPRLTWGPIVLCQSYRNPALVAKMVANLCAFLPGKVVFGVGAGWKDDEYRAYNWEFPRPAVRIQQLEEAIEIARRLWREDNVSYEGRHYRLANAYLQPKPVPVPPVMVGGGGEQLMLRLVARQADWWNIPGGSLENYTRKSSLLDQYCEEIGRDPVTVRRTWSCEVVAVAGTEAEARRQAEASPFNGGAAIVGTPSMVLDQLAARQAVGVSLFQLRFADFPRTDGIQCFVRDVLPHLCR